MSAINTKSTKAQILAAYNDLARELELTKRQLAETTTEKGILMSEVTALKSEVQILKECYDDVEAQLIAAEERITKQGQVIAAQPKTAPPAKPKPPAPKPLPAHTELEPLPVIQITDADRNTYAKFNALPREKRLAIINWARPQFGHVGINNIIEIRAAWHEFNNVESCSDEANLADIA